MIYSAGILFFKKIGGITFVYLVHPSSTIHDNRKATWSIPKGEYDPFSESSYSAAIREIKEELGLAVSELMLQYLGQVVYKNRRKVVIAFVHELPDQKVVLSWEIDAFAPFTLDAAKTHLHPDQVEFITRLKTHLEVTE